MIERIRNPLLAVLLAAAPGTVISGPAVEVSGAWMSRPASEAVVTAGGFMCLHNHGEQPMQLTGATSPLAGRIELHSMKHDDGVARMAQLARIEIGAGREVCLDPGGLHLMIFEMDEQLYTGQDMPVTLQLSAGETLEIVLTQKRLEDMKPPSHSTHKH
jgi:hypothetical protein